MRHSLNADPLHRNRAHIVHNGSSRALPPQHNRMENMQPIPPTRHGSGPRRGFSLVELVLVLTIIGVLASIVGPNLRTADFELNAAAREVATTLAYAQSQAVLRGHDFVLAFDTVAGRMTIHADADNDGGMDDGEDTRTYALGGSIRFGRGSAPARLVDGTAATAAVSMGATQDGHPALTFKRNGSASEESVVYIRPSGDDATDTRALEIARATGRVRCHSYRTGTWEAEC
jgi:prepilin-type N-terminal cleavage/methylation domain-containing protein